jgi:integrase
MDGWPGHHLTRRVSGPGEPGVPIAVIAAWLGHARAAFTMAVYAHSQDDALKAAASSFARRFRLSSSGTRLTNEFR